MFVVLAKQILLMFLYMGIGVCLYKKQIITCQGSKELGTLLLYVVMPCVIIRSFLQEYSTERVLWLLETFVISLLSLLLSMVISYIVFGTRQKIENFSASFSNAGFIGIPLVQGVLGGDSVFFVAFFVALLNLFQWTYGVVVITGKKEYISWKKLAKNPILISLLAGCILFICRIEMPLLFRMAIDSVSSLNAPVAMIIMGVYLAQTKLRELFLDKQAWVCSIIRLIVIPSATLLLLYILQFGNLDMKWAVFLVAVTPVGVNVAIFAQIYDLDYTKAVHSICLSTLLSLAVIPVVVQAATWVM